MHVQCIYMYTCSYLALYKLEVTCAIYVILKHNITQLVTPHGEDNTAYLANDKTTQRTIIRHTHDLQYVDTI